MLKQKKEGGGISPISGTSKGLSWLHSQLRQGPNQSTKTLGLSDLLSSICKLQHFYSSHAFSGKTALFLSGKDSNLPVSVA